MLSNIRPIKTLYFFQEPQIFVALDEGNLLLLCLKVDEIESGNLYLVAATSNSLLESLVAGSTSLLAAFHQPWCWLVTTDNGFQSTDVQSITINDVPKEYLPYSGAGLYPDHGIIKDQYYRAERDKPFLSVKFEGDSLRDGKMGFDVFAGLVQSTYQSLRRLFIPAVDQLTKRGLSEASLSKVLFMPMREVPRFASLQIEVDRPEVNVKGVRQDVNLTDDNTEETMDNYSSQFMREAVEINRIAKQEHISKQFSYGLTSAFEALHLLVPSDGSVFEEIRIDSRTADGDHSVVIDLDAGRRISEAYKHLTRGKRSIIGSVVELNKRSSSFIVRTNVGREVTCVVTSAEVQAVLDTLADQPLVKVFGTYEKRVRRDKMSVKGLELMAND